MVHAILFGISEGTVSPHAARPWPATKPAMSMASCTSPPASTRILPASPADQLGELRLALGEDGAGRGDDLGPLRAPGTRAQCRCASAAARDGGVDVGRGAPSVASPTTSAGRAGLVERNVVMFLSGVFVSVVGDFGTSVPQRWRQDTLSGHGRARPTLEEQREP